MYIFIENYVSNLIKIHNAHFGVRLMIAFLVIVYRNSITQMILLIFTTVNLVIFQLFACICS